MLRTREIYRDIYFNLRNIVNKSAKDVLVKMRQLYFREIYSVVSELSQYYYYIIIILYYYYNNNRVENNMRGPGPTQVTGTLSS